MVKLKINYWRVLHFLEPRQARSEQDKRRTPDVPISVTKFDWKGKFMPR
jgi:hypothetical protein